MKPTRKQPRQIPPQKPDTTSWVEIVASKAKALRYGIIEIVVHDGRVVQVEQIERFRFDETGSLREPATGGDSSPTALPPEEG